MYADVLMLRVLMTSSPHRRHGTRYKAWPKVAEFVTSLPKGSMIGDIGCGNGKNIPACNEVGLGIGYDISIELVKICPSKKCHVLTQNVLVDTGGVLLHPP